MGPSKQGFAVAMSGDGTVLAVCGNTDNNTAGAVWAFSQDVHGNWVPKGQKVTLQSGTAEIPKFYSIYLSDDGSSLIVGGIEDTSKTGAIWIYIFESNAIWVQQEVFYCPGTTPVTSFDPFTNPLVWKLVGDNSIGYSEQGHSVSSNSNASAIVVGGYMDNNSKGAIWVWLKEVFRYYYNIGEGVFYTDYIYYQNAKVTGTGLNGDAQLGYSVAMSGDGKTIAAGGPYDNLYCGAIWIFTQSGLNNITQQGSALRITTYGNWALLGSSISLSYDGNTLASSAPLGRTIGIADVWVFTRVGNSWTQQAIVRPSNVYGASQSVSLSNDGNMLAVGDYYGGYGVDGGIALMFHLGEESGWTQVSSVLQGSDKGASTSAIAGTSVSIARNSNTLVAIGRPSDNGGVGAAWVFESTCPAPTIPMVLYMLNCSTSIPAGYSCANRTINSTYRSTPTPLGLTLLGSGQTVSADPMVSALVIAPPSVVIPSLSLGAYTCYTVEIWFSVESALPHGRYVLYSSTYFTVTYVVSKTTTNAPLTYFAVNDGSGELQLVTTSVTSSGNYQLVAVRQRTATTQVCLGKFGSFSPSCTTATTPSGSETSSFDSSTLTNGSKIMTIYYMAMYESCFLSAAIVVLFQYLSFVGPAIQSTTRTLFVTQT